MKHFGEKYCTNIMQKPSVKIPHKNGAHREFMREKYLVNIICSNSNEQRTS